jgi:hypothetical protein
MTGSTSTSIWKNYQEGVRNYCGHILPVSTTAQISRTFDSSNYSHDLPCNGLWIHRYIIIVYLLLFIHTP